MMNNLLANSHGFYSMFGLGMGLFALGTIFFAIFMLAIIALKGYALWHAAKRDDKGWFVAILIVNTFGILEIIYLYFVVEKWKKEDKIKENIVKDNDDLAK